MFQRYLISALILFIGIQPAIGGPLIDMFHGLQNRIVVYYEHPLNTRESLRAGIIKFKTGVGDVDLNFLIYMSLIIGAMLVVHPQGYFTLLGFEPDQRF